MNRRIAALYLALFTLAGVGPVCERAYGEDSVAVRVTVLDLSNETGDLAFDGAANAVSGSLSLILRQLRRYEVVERTREGVTLNDVSLSSLADELQTEYILYGMIRRVSADALTLAVSLYDRQSRKTVHTELSAALGLFDVFSGADAIVDSILERLTGSRIPYSFLAIEADGPFIVQIDGERIDVATGGEPVRIVSGTHEINLGRANSAVAPIRFEQVFVEEALYTLLPAPQESGGNMVVMESLPAENGLATLSLSGLPSSLTLLLDGIEIPDFTQGVFDVSPGVHTIAYRQGRAETHFPLSIASGTSNALEWIYPALRRAKVSFTKSKDGWKDIDPVFEARVPVPFMGDDSYGLKRFYICRDDKYLYWRADFFGKNPLKSLPPESRLGICAGVNIHGAYEKNPLDVYIMTENVLKGRKTFFYSQHSNHDFSRMSNIDPVAAHDGDDWFEARIRLSSFLRSCKRPFYMVFVEANHTDLSLPVWKSDSQSQRFICSVNLAK